MRSYTYTIEGITRPYQNHAWFTLSWAVVGVMPNGFARVLSAHTTHSKAQARYEQCCRYGNADLWEFHLVELQPAKEER